MSKKTSNLNPEIKWLRILVPSNIAVVVTGIVIIAVFQDSLFASLVGRLAIILLFVGVFGILFGYMFLAQEGMGGFLIWFVVTGITVGITLAVLFVIGIISLPGGL